MKLRTSVLAFVVSISCSTLCAQNSSADNDAKSGDNGPAPDVITNPNAVPQQIFYKWHSRGTAHYGKYLPRGVTKYTKVNNQGMVVSDRPNNDTYTVLRPMRPATPNASDSKNRTANSPTEALPEGSITKQKRCEIAQTNMKTMNEKKTIFEDDGSGNLIPLSADDINSRRQQAQNDIDHFCGDSKPSTSAVPAARSFTPPPPPPANDGKASPARG